MLDKVATYLAITSSKKAAMFLQPTFFKTFQTVSIFKMSKQISEDAISYVAAQLTPNEMNFTPN